MLRFDLMRGRTFTLVCALALAARPAEGHGRFPALVSIAVGPEGALWAGTTFGLLLSRDGGSTWRWICEESIRYPTNLDPEPIVSPLGTIYLPAISRLIVSRDGGCTFTEHPTLRRLGGISLAVHPSTPATVLAATAKTSSGGAEAGTLFRSEDDGLSFSERLHVEGELFTSVAFAPNRPERIYVGSYSYRHGTAAIHRSDDGGERFEELPVALTATSAVRVLAVSPTDEDVLLILIEHDSVVRVSTDGGRTSTTALEAGAPVSGAAFSRDGRTVFIATREALHRSSDGGRSFIELATPARNACITIDDDAAYSCGWEPVDTWSLAKGGLDGENFSALYHLSDVKGVVDCPAGTPSRDVCDEYWPALASFFGIDDPQLRAPPMEEESDGCSTLRGSGSIVLLAVGVIILIARRRRTGS
jgi:photosystem II stability/assembly factor-like uncharacterized protein